MYIAWNIEFVNQNVYDEEFLLKERLPFHEALRMVHKNEITDSKTIITLLRGWRWWQENSPFDLGIDDQ